MTNTIVVQRASSPFDFLMNYLYMLGGSPDFTNTAGISVTPEGISDHDGVPYVHCSHCGEEYDDDMLALKFQKEWEGRLISFVEYTCTRCGERQYGV